MEVLGAYAFIIASIMGFMEFVKALFAKDYERAIKIAGSALIGALCGIYHINNLDITTGIQIGLAACGVYKGLTLAGGNNTQTTTTKVIPTLSP